MFLDCRCETSSRRKPTPFELRTTPEAFRAENVLLRKLKCPFLAVRHNGARLCCRFETQCPEKRSQHPSELTTTPRSFPRGKRLSEKLKCDLRAAGYVAESDHRISCPDPNCLPAQRSEIFGPRVLPRDVSGCGSPSNQPITARHGQLATGFVTWNRTCQFVAAAATSAPALCRES